MHEVAITLEIQKKTLVGRAPAFITFPLENLGFRTVDESGRSVCSTSTWLAGLRRTPKHAFIPNRWVNMDCIVKKTVVKARRHKDIPVTPAVLAMAIKRGAKRKEHAVHATGVAYERTRKEILLSFRDGCAIGLPVGLYPELASLSERQLAKVCLDAVGEAVCFDEADVHIDLMGMFLASPSLCALAVSMAGARNGRRISEAKSTAAWANGARGGRPRKQPSAE